jgi:hypothetical protein
MGQQARKDVENNFSRTVFLEKHLQLYQNFEHSLSKISRPSVVAPEPVINR